MDHLVSKTCHQIGCIDCWVGSNSALHRQCVLSHLATWAACQYLTQLVECSATLHSSSSSFQFFKTPCPAIVANHRICFSWVYNLTLLENYHQCPFIICSSFIFRYNFTSNFLEVQSVALVIIYPQIYLRNFGSRNSNSSNHC